MRKGNESLLVDHPFLNRVIVRDKSRGSIRSILGAIKDVRAARYDAVINLHRFTSSGWITFFAKGKKKIGFKKNPFSWSFSESFEHTLGEKGDSNFSHEVERNHKLIEQWAPVMRLPKLYPKENFKSPKVNELLDKANAPVVLAPTSVWFTKQWPAEKWAELISMMPEECVVLIGAPQDRIACEGIINATNHTNVHNLCGELNLLESAALMKKAKRVIANDSAPMHLATSVNAPCTAVYCSTIPAFGFGPLSGDAEIVQTKETLSCRPCGLHGKRQCPEGHFRCALSIEANEVLRTIS